MNSVLTIPNTPPPGQMEARVEGNPGSRIRVLIFEDLQCSDCAKLRLMLDQQILPRYAARAGFEHRDFPLAKHAWAGQAAAAARYFWNTEPELGIAWQRFALSHLDNITPANFEAKLSEWAVAHGVSAADAVAGLNDESIQAAVEKDHEDGVSRGISRTPTLLLNGESLIETFTFDEIARSLDRALAGR